eukprot:Plantae.Rhodophyta-Purpureofilum_apyrenoidigerum.ctg6915.p1 GENE.Plantae.Rhodophyta-Purpureofilum_apyrenoidigerum.ctg6915~~Plantae.Rhodophyta-Purpureofilum_apyrenoidigerum.ctg6915.p1  ORF type:complete len:393 (+),score=56.85 Plantae.Rhodophyta-Purpureofilum_apyrenoidigerum.ctg6915:64-1242(+)
MSGKRERPQSSGNEEEDMFVTHVPKPIMAAFEADDDKPSDESDHDSEFWPSNLSKKKRRGACSANKEQPGKNEAEKMLECGFNLRQQSPRRERPGKKHANSSNSNSPTARPDFSDDGHQSRLSMDSLVRDAETVVKESEATQQFFERTNEDPVIIIDDDDGMPVAERVVTRVQYGDKPPIKVHQFKNNLLSDAFEVTCFYFKLDPSQYKLTDNRGDIMLKTMAGDPAISEKTVFRVIPRNSTGSHRAPLREAHNISTVLIDSDGDHVSTEYAETGNSEQHDLNDTYTPALDERPAASDPASYNAGGVGLQTSTFTNDKYIHLKIRAPDHPTRKYRMRTNDPLWKILNRFCEFENMDINRAKIVFDGDVIDSSTTPTELDLMDNDLLDVSERK